MAKDTTRRVAAASAATAERFITRPRLLSFLDKHAAAMPRTVLRYAMGHLDETQREHYLGMRKAGGS